VSPEREIHCTRCDSSVAWSPFCPRCGAYLEFAGNPPWHPDTAGIDSEVDDVTEEIVVVAEPEVETAPIEDEDFAHLYSEPAAEASHVDRRGFGAVLGFVVIGLLGGVGLTYLTTIWIGGMFGLVGLVWAMALWPRRSRAEDVPSAAPPMVSAIDEVVVAVPVAAEHFHVQESAPPTVEARAPQYVPTRAIEVPVVKSAPAVVGEVACTACGELNVRGRHFCAWCGAVMPDAAIVPPTVPHLEAAVDAEGAKDSRGRTPRLSRSWRGPIVAGTLVFVFLSAIVLAVFGPFAFQFRLGTTQVFQAINTFIDPYAGNQPNLQDATATSSLPGADPDQLLGNDASTFWASEPSFIFGAGNSVTLRFDRQHTINRAVILPGIQNGLFDVRALATPASVTLTFDDGTSITHELDNIESQNNYRQLIEFPKTTTNSVTLRFDSVYPPRKGSENLVGSLAVSGVYFIEPPVPPSILTVPTEIRENPALPGTTN